ncbi:MAG: hypothetical protein B7Y88_05555 [Sphingomonadales bacterium 32-64-17]|nr:MAG: hypothetical protein B7Y88_05555 [Sphingomonadales bacterium 32-64-17]
MTTPNCYRQNFIPIKYFLSSYRALSDGRFGIKQLKKLLEDEDFLISEWKVVWIGTCATLRSAVELFRVDAQSCLSQNIRNELKAEWEGIKERAELHPIYWEFLKKERDNIIHEYKWSAYEAWLSPDGAIQSPPTLLGRLVASSDVSPSLLMKGGEYEGFDSVALLAQASEWIEERIFSSIRRAGFDPEEKRGVSNFEPISRHQSDQLPLMGLLAKYK